MNRPESVAIILAFLGLGAGAFLVAQRPSVWIKFGVRLGKVLLPLVWRMLEKWRQGDEWMSDRRGLIPEFFANFPMVDDHINFLHPQRIGS